jgi:hypothetical protein
MVAHDAHSAGLERPTVKKLERILPVTSAAADKTAKQKRPRGLGTELCSIKSKAKKTAKVEEAFPWCVTDSDLKP